MRLKSLELVGFKSFADRTVIEFGEGITAIVGPNGCGKSNLSDAIRWVLGEQSARLLRGAKMEDCIFSGTDARQPLNLAEVSLTFTDCEKVLTTEYHEVTVTRRVFRTGEGQYFINKTPCRLKDIQRLFMDTGIGTNSYSLMEQGRIDLILRSRPDDRREVFEEASGITKYKTDKREALRKLEQTESNLLRLADIIREVKRQIISLQRQAGKAARHRKLYEDLRRLDIFLAREKLAALAKELQAMETTLAALNENIEALQQDIQRHELQEETLRGALAGLEEDLAREQQADLEKQTLLERTRQELENARRRERELEELIQRDTGDLTSATRALDTDRHALEQSLSQLKEVSEQLKVAEEELQVKSGKNAELEQALEQTKQEIQKLLAETLELDDRHSRLQNELRQMENEDHQLVSRRERCAAEQSNLQQILNDHQKRIEESSQTFSALEAGAAQAEEQLKKLCADHEQLLANRKNLENNLAENQTQAAALNAQVALLTKSLNEQAERSGSVQQVLNDPGALGVDKRKVLGSLTDQITAKPEYARALEAVLRMWLEAVVVADEVSARELLLRLGGDSKESICLLVADGSEDIAQAPAPAPTIQEVGTAVALCEQVSAAKALRPMLRRLLSQVWVVDSLEMLPSEIPPDCVFVTRQGAVVRGQGAWELYGDSAQNLAIKRRQVASLQEALSGPPGDSANGVLAKGEVLRRELEAKLIQQTELDGAIGQARAVLDEKRTALARQEGAREVAVRQAQKVQDNLETVTFELQELSQQGSTPERKSAVITQLDECQARRVAIKPLVETRNRELSSLEQEHKQSLQEVMAANVRMAERRQAVEHLSGQGQPLSERIAQAEAASRERSARVEASRAAIELLKRTVVEQERKLPDLEAGRKTQQERLRLLQEKREGQQAEFKTVAEQLKKMRATIETQRVRQNELTVKSTETRLKHEHILERATSEYRLAADAIQAEPEPEWSDGVRPALEAIEGQVAELRAKIEAMGPVNTGAIDEYQQLQERFDFLRHQQDDLVKSKQQLMEMIRKINQTTTDLFSKTFAQINENFQSMFQQLFGGGTAKLILTDEEDILECGIEIYARPPGKRLQSISLLSGGESTMTAVALLFAIYMVKPSPFCLLDELDAALDDSNIHRFVKVLQSFLNQSQFLVITHNRQTIGAAGTLYGVTMEAAKVSRIISMRFADQRGAPAPSPAREEPAVLQAVKTEDPIPLTQEQQTPEG